jgi:MFS family permease
VFRREPEQGGVEGEVTKRDMNDIPGSPPSLVSTVGDADRPNRLALLMRAFSHRNYRLFFAGQIVSLGGTFLTQVAVMWLVYHLTQSTWLLGVVAFAGQIPMFVLAPFAGVWVDRLNRRRLLVITQVLSMLQSFGLAALAFFAIANHSGSIIGGIIALAAFQGLVNAFDMPGRQAFLVEMVTRPEDLGNAIALNSTMVHGARLIGPALAGFLIHYVGASACFFLDGASYIAVIAALLAMRIAPRPPRQSASSVRAELYEGLRYIWKFQPIRVLLLLMATLSLTGMPAFTVLMPVYGEHFGGEVHSAETLGFLMGASGLGALCAALYLGVRRSVLGLGRLMVVAMMVFGLAILAFSFSDRLWVSLCIVPVAGLGMLLSFASANTLIQTLTEDRMRGRVMSFFSMAFAGMLPWGNLLAGSIAGHFGPGVVGASRTLMWASAIVLLTAVAFALTLPAMRRVIRPIYVQRGILPAEMAAGIETATEVVRGPEH